MKCSVTFRHMKPSDPIREYAEDRIDRITRLIDRGGEAQVVLSVEKHLHVAHIEFLTEGALRIRSIEKSEDMYGSIDTADALGLLEKGLAYRDFTPPDEFAAAREAAKASSSGSFARLSRELASRVSEEEREERAQAGEPHAIRFRVPDGVTEWEDLVHGPTRFDNAEIDDLVILRSDGTPIYNLAVVSDDAEMAISHVIRGDDHISNTPKQILLYEAMGRPVPLFGHVPMILGPDGKRLSKRHGATAVESYGEQGILPEAMVNFLALLGWSPGTDEELLSLDDLVARFSMDRVLKKGAVFDTEKLFWFNAQYLAGKDPSELGDDLRARLGDTCHGWRHEARSGG